MSTVHKKRLASVFNRLIPLALSELSEASERSEAVRCQHWPKVSKSKTHGRFGTASEIGCNVWQIKLPVNDCSDMSDDAYHMRAVHKRCRSFGAFLYANSVVKFDAANCQPKRKD